jgi:hypothetical protein
LSTTTTAPPRVQKLKRVDSRKEPGVSTLITTEAYTKDLGFAVESLQSLQTMVASQQTIIADQGIRITRLESKTVDARQDDELNRLRKWAALPWYKRLFKPPPE